MPGDVDAISVELLAERVPAEAGEGEDVETDLSDLRFIDIAGLCVFHEATVQLGKAGKNLTLVSGPPPSRECSICSGGVDCRHCG